MSKGKISFGYTHLLDPGEHMIELRASSNPDKNRGIPAKDLYLDEDRKLAISVAQK